MSMHHTIRITPASPGKYSADLAGQTIVADSAAPIVDAAKAILASGADDHDTLHVISADATFSAVTLAKLATDHKPPRHSDVARWLKAQSRY